MPPSQSQWLTAKATVKEARSWQPVSSGTPCSLQTQLHPLAFSGEEPGAKAALAKVVAGEVGILPALLSEAVCEQPGAFFPFESSLLLTAGRFPHHLFLSDSLLEAS